MKRTLVLAVDRDDDFGVKANISTPAIGLEDTLQAAMALGSIDPEDSDVNSLFFAIRIYNELLEEGKDVQIALVCGDKKVGYVSDAAVIDELEFVIESVKPDRVILVSDGAEDEYVYPIISSRVPIDSVKKVFVKQAPGLEGSLYILSRMLRDSDKRRRFLAPIGWILMIAGLIFMVPRMIMYFDTGSADYIYGMTGNLVVFFLGAIFTAYAYDLWDKMHVQYERVISDVKSGNLSIIFTVLAVALLVCGIVLGALEVNSMYDSSIIHMLLVFASNLLWFLVFAVMCHGLGQFIDNYMKTKTFTRAFMIGSITTLALALVVQAVIDILCSTLGYAYPGEGVIIYELVIGVGFGLCAAVIQRSFKEFYEKTETEDTDLDAIQ